METNNDDGPTLRVDGAAASAPGRRLATEDVQAIFRCLRNQGPTPAHPAFSIVPVGQHGHKLSPPSIEFALGVYVLLRPDKKPKKATSSFPVPRAPPHLEHLIIHQHFPEECPWGLSGPQFPHPTEIQQRYCYPKGRPEYSCRIGGSLWTMLNADGRDDPEFRVLHVYYSAKRAVNQASSPILSDRLSPSKRTRRLHHTPDRLLQHPPAITNSSTSRNCLSPSSHRFDLVPSPNPGHAFSYHHHHHHHHPYHQLSHHHQYPHQRRYYHNHHPHMPTGEQVGIVNPRNIDIFRRPPHPGEFVSHSSPQQRLTAANAERLQSEPYTIHRHVEHPPQIRQHLQLAPSEDSGTGEEPRQPPPPPPNPPPVIQKTEVKSHDSIETKSSTISAVEPLEFDSPSLKDIDSYWNDPLLSIMLKPSQDNSSIASLPPLANKAPDRSLHQRLETLQYSIREVIMQAPNPEEQESLVSTVSSWASALARDPLGDSTQGEPYEDTSTPEPAESMISKPKT